MRRRAWLCASAALLLVLEVIVHRRGCPLPQSRRRSAAAATRRAWRRRPSFRWDCPRLRRTRRAGGRPAPHSSVVCCLLQKMGRRSPRALPVVLAVQPAWPARRQPQPFDAFALRPRVKYDSTKRELLAIPSVSRTLEPCLSLTEVSEGLPARNRTGRSPRRRRSDIPTGVDTRRLRPRVLAPNQYPDVDAHEKSPPSYAGEKTPSPAAAPRRPRPTLDRPARRPLQVRACRSSAA